MKGLVKNSRCVILPSEWYENGPYSVMEAMAAGKPAIVSNLGGLPELVEDGVTGYVVSAFNAAALGAAMEKMESLSDEALFAMGTAAAEKAREKFDGSKYVEELLQKYEELTIIEQKLPDTILSGLASRKKDSLEFLQKIKQSVESE